MRITRSKADALFSRYVRLRDNWTCQRCGKRDEGGQECAHIYSRRHWATRHDPNNAVTLCTACHFYFGGNPLVFAKWCDEKFGEEEMDRLFKRSHSVGKKSKHDESLRVMALKEMVARLEAL